MQDSWWTTSRGQVEYQDLRPRENCAVQPAMELESLFDWMRDLKRLATQWSTTSKRPRLPHLHTLSVRTRNGNRFLVSCLRLSDLRIPYRLGLRINITDSRLI
jgi:hypothetical protein